MYGLLLDAFMTYVIREFGENVWVRVRDASNIATHSFDAQKVYRERDLRVMCQQLATERHLSIEVVMEKFGAFFLHYVIGNGYGQVLKVLGRDLRDFLNGLDHLHEYLRVTFPHMRAPTFVIESEDETGLVLQYRTRRRGFVHYVRGQIRAVAKVLFDTDVDVDVIGKRLEHDVTCYEMRISFDNHSFSLYQQRVDPIYSDLSLPADKLFEIFPFAIAFRSDMRIFLAGESMMQHRPKILNSCVTDLFVLTRPLVDFSWETILSRRNMVFQLTMREFSDGEEDWNSDKPRIPSASQLDDKLLTFKGTMHMFEEWNAMAFLCNPMVFNTDMLIDYGLFVNDLSKHDSSRELVLAGNQVKAEKQLSSDRDAWRVKTMISITKRMEVLLKEADELLYSMIPKTVADKLRSGFTPVEVCESHDAVTILFTDIVNFTRISESISPMGVVKLLNELYTKFDTLSEFHNVYKVETIGDSYMVVSGAPNPIENHAWHVADMALDLVSCVREVPDPVNSNRHVRIRLGSHSGPVVAGVVGKKMPRYCLFGDTVNTAARMESTGNPMKIQISEAMQRLLPPDQYVIEKRGDIEVKGKGIMTTYWLIGRHAKTENHAKSPCVGQVDKLVSKSPTDSLYRTMRLNSLTNSVDDSMPPSSELDDKNGDVTVLLSIRQGTLELDPAFNEVDNMQPLQRSHVCSVL